MVNVIAVPLPEHSLIAGKCLCEGYVTDCFRNEITKTVDLSDFIDAFYKTPLCRFERLVLSLAPTGRMRDVDITALSKEQMDRISVWQVETRLDAQILLSAGGTKSWWMVEQMESGTRLYFGSVLVPRPSSVEGKSPKVSWFINNLMGAHLMYSRLLLGAAARRFSQNA